MQNLNNKAIVIDEHTLGVVMGGYVQILRASILRGSPYPGQGYICLPQDDSSYRKATEKDFEDYWICFHPDYI